MRFSANTGFLWTDLPFAERVREAARAGFDAVEFHDEAQTEDPARLDNVLREAALPVVGLNTRMGPTAGCAAIPGDEALARADIDLAVAVAARIGAGAVHVLSGKTDHPDARACLVAALRHTLHQTEGSDRLILIEPVSAQAIPGYFLRDIDQAAEIIAEIGHPRLKVMFDCFHMAATHGDVSGLFAQYHRQIGHIQIAGFPGRHEPLGGTLDVKAFLRGCVDLGYVGHIGCEYRATADVANALAQLRRALGDV